MSHTGSMRLYADLVQRALAIYAPQLDTLPISLVESHSAGDDNALRARGRRLWEIALARLRAGQIQASVFHVLDGSSGFMLAGIPWERVLVTVHDLIPALQASDRFPIARPSWAARRLITASLGVIRKAGATCAVSQATADDLAALTGRKVDAVIPLYLREFPPVSEPAQSNSHREGPYLLHVGNGGFYKNRLGVLAVFARLAEGRQDLRLVFAGAEGDAVLCREIAALGLTNRVKFEVDPDDARLAALYRGAALMLFPSLYEGFGWPPLEAMHFGCPVVCSDAGSLPEVTGDAALRCAPDDVAGLAAAAMRILDDRDLARDLVVRGTRNLERFTAQRMAAELVRLYEGLADG